MAKKIQLQDANGNVLHPLTLGECVTMDNGENLDTLMSKSQMFTPTITQDKSMFKVGTGVDVDYSANVKDGAYESLVFKGKSLVNLLTSLRPDTHSAWVRNGSSFTLNASGVLFLNYTALLKPNTTYTVVGELDFDVDGIVIGFREGNKSWEVNRSVGSRGRFAVLISTSAESTSNALTVHRAVTSNSDRVTLSNLMVLEGDWTNAELPSYFEGLGSCKMPILRNLSSEAFCHDSLEAGTISGSGGVDTTASNARARTKGKKRLNGATSVLFSDNLLGVEKYLFSYDSNGKYLGRTPDNWETGNEIKPVDGAYYYRVVFAKYSEELPHSMHIIPKHHKSNILRTSEEIVLREVGGIQDTYNPLTGEYTKRIGEIVLDGSEGWGLWKTETPYLLFEWHSSLPIKNGNTTSVILADKLPVFTGDVLWNSSESRGIGSNENRFRIRIECETAEALKSWLQSNPITVQYELAEPVTTIVKPSTMTPFAYQNGHVIVESGFEGQSLLPEIEYSVVTGRTGQVTQNTKVLRQQEQQIIGLEELLLTQVVQMEYERTLLQFDYELQMMMLG